MTPQEILEAATKEFEASFAYVGMGSPAANFTHESKIYQYVVVTGDGVKKEGESFPVYDTPEEAITALKAAWKPFEGKRFLFWRTRPEIAQDENEKCFWVDKDEPNPTFGKWKTYSRFRAID